MSDDYAAGIEAAARLCETKADLRGWDYDLPSMGRELATRIRALAAAPPPPVPAQGESGADDSPTVPREWLTHWQTKCQATASLLKAAEARIRELEGEVARLRADNDDAYRALGPTCRFMGGSPSLGDQVRNMYDELKAAEARVDRLTAAAQAARTSLRYADIDFKNMGYGEDHSVRNHVNEALASLGPVLDGGEG